MPGVCFYPETVGSVLRPGPLPQMFEQAAAVFAGAAAMDEELVGVLGLADEGDAAGAAGGNHRARRKAHLDPTVVGYRVGPEVVLERVELLSPEGDEPATGGVEEGRGVVAIGRTGAVRMKLGPDERVEVERPEIVRVVRGTEELGARRVRSLTGPKAVAAEDQQREGGRIVP